MNIEAYRAEMKDSYIAADVICPHCGKMFQKHSAYHCPECLVKIFDKDENGQVILIDPKTADKSRKYKVSGISEETSEHYSGELVTVAVPRLTDCRFGLTADGIELSLNENGSQLTAQFLMPSHDVVLEKSCVNDMSYGRAANMAMNGMGGLSSLIPKE